MTAQNFAFYGRVATEDQQDPTSSRLWQLPRSEALILPHGRVVREFFDIGQSRSLPWKRRPGPAQTTWGAPKPGPHTPGTATWLPTGGYVTVAGRTVKGGMVYIGSRAPSGDGQSVEPGLMDPSLPVGWDAPAWAGRNTGFWP